MKRGTAAGFAAVLTCSTLLTAACACAQAAEPFPEVPLPPPAVRPHRWAYASMVAGAGLVAGSFAFERRADEAYARYLASTDPARIEDEFRRARHNDQLSSAALFGGEALVAFGLYLRFLRHPASDRLSLEWRGDRCALSLRY